MEAYRLSNLNVRTWRLTLFRRRKEIKVKVDDVSRFILALASRRGGRKLSLRYMM